MNFAHILKKKYYLERNSKGVIRNHQSKKDKQCNSQK